MRYEGGGYGISERSSSCTGMVILGIGGGEELGRKPVRKVFQDPCEK